MILWIFLNGNSFKLYDAKLSLLQILFCVERVEEDAVEASALLHSRRQIPFAVAA